MKKEDKAELTHEEVLNTSSVGNIVPSVFFNGSEVSYAGKPKDYPITDILYYDFGASIQPKRIKEDDACMDVYYQGYLERDEETGKPKYGEIIKKDYILQPGESVVSPLQFGLGIPYGMMALVLPRSGQASIDIDVRKPPVDTGYIGVIHAMVHNDSNRPMILKVDERFAQVVIIPIITNTRLVTVDPKTMKTERGATGFNGSGTK